MANKTDVNLARLGDSRVFIQNAPTPANGFLYQGCLSLGEGDQDQGAAEPSYCPSSERRNAWDIVDVIPQAPALGSLDFTQRMDRYGRDIWWALKKNGCTFTLAVPFGRCQRPDNFNDWDSVILYTYSRMTNLTLPAANPLTGDDNAEANLTGSLEFRSAEIIRRLVFGEKADSTILAEVLDGFYNDVASCGDCGTASDGCAKQYWLTAANSGSPGRSSQLVVTIDNKSTYFTVDITPLGGLSANRMAAVGQYVVIVSQANGGHVYGLFTDVDAQTSNFTLITSGYVAGKAPRAIWSKNSAQTYVGGAGGYLYLLSSATGTPTVLTDGSLTTQDFNDVHGYGNTVVAVANSNGMVYSENGSTFAAVTGPEVGVNLTSVFCLSDSIWFVGTGSGKVWYTLNKGVSWTQTSALPGGATVVNDIQFVDANVGYVAYQVGGTAKIAWTIASGNSWLEGSPRLSRVPTAERYNVVVPCGYNEVSIGGRESAGGDGLIAVAN